MAKKSRKPQSMSRKRLWDQEDVTQLLAWLDYCKLEGIDFESTVVNHLKVKTQKDFSLRQVHGRLEREWKNLGHADSKTVNDLYLQGTDCLVELHYNERELIQQAISSLGIPSLRYRLRGTSTTLRSHSEGLSTTHQHSQRSRSSTLSSIATSKIEGFQPCATVRDNVSGYGDGDLARQLSEDVSLTPAPLLLQIQLPENRTPQEAGFAEVKAETVAIGQPVLPDLPISVALSRNSEIRALKQELSKARKELHVSAAKVRRLQNEVFNLNDCLCATRNGYEELQHRNRAVAANRGDTSLLAILQDENTVLKKSLLAMQNSRQDIKKIETFDLGPSNTDVENEAFLICSEILDACSSLSFQGLLVDESLLVTGLDNTSSAMSVWAKRVSGLEAGLLLQRCLELGVDQFEVLRSLVAAGLCALVLEPPFSQLTAIDSPVLKHYRQQLLSRDGPKALQQLDLLAYKSLISDETFEICVINERGKSISEYLCHVIQSFLAWKTTAETESKRSESEGHSQSDEVEVEASPAAFFEHIVQRALRLKLHLDLSSRQCLWVFFKPGEVFDPQVMKTKCAHHEGPGSAKRQRHLSHRTNENPTSSEAIKLCIFPALYREQSSDHSTNDCGSVVWNGFSLRKSSEDLQGLQLISKAVVLI